jgi:hypothetical protein
MRIEEHADLKPQLRESFRRSTRLDWALLSLGLFVPLIMLGMQWLRQLAGHHVTSSQWIGAGVFGFVLMVLLQAAFWFYLGGNRYAEFQDDRVRLGRTVGSISLHPSQLVSCKVEPDERFPELSLLSIAFHTSRSRLSRPKCWSMLVDDREEAEKFCRALEASAVADGAPISSAGD